MFMKFWWDDLDYMCFGKGGHLGLDTSGGGGAGAYSGFSVI